MKNRPHRINLALILSLLTVITACTTTPYTRLLTPSISGRIMLNGEAAKGVAVFLATKATDITCRKSAQKTVTDIDGQFFLPAAKEHMSYTPLMTYYLNEWVVCAETSAGKHSMFSGNEYGQGSVNQSINLICEPGSTQSERLTCELQSSTDN